MGPAEYQVRITLDPLAECLAGLGLLELYGAKEGQWKPLLAEVEKKEGVPQSIEGFLRH